MSAYYYPEGSFGPICDVILPEVVTGPYLPSELRDREEDDGISVIEDPRTDIPGTPDGEYMPRFFPGLPRFKRQKCKVREDGTFYDCEYEYDLPVNWDCEGLNPPKEGCAGFFPTPNFDFDPSFFKPIIGPDSCISWDPEINIKPIKYYKPNGLTITKYRKQRSTPLTYPVTSETQETIVENDLTVQFDSTGSNLIVTGTAGNGRVALQLDWDDSLKTAQTALGKIEVNGLTFLQHYCRNVADLSLTLSGTSLMSWGSGSGERGGFRKPVEHDGIGNQYIAFGSAGTSPFNSLQSTRTATVNLDLSDANVLFVYAIMGNDKNGGERVNDPGEGLKVVWPNGDTTSFDGLESYQDSNQSRSTWDQRNSKFRYCETRIPNAYRTSNVNVQFKQTLTSTSNELSNDPTISLAAFFNQLGNIEITGQGSGTLTLNFDWDDNPNTYGQAVNTIEVGGQTFTQSGSGGSQSKNISISAGQTINVTYNSDNLNYRLVDNGRVVCLMDRDNDDCNANLRIGNISMDPVASQDPNCFDSIGIARIGYRGGNIEDKVNKGSIRKSKNFAAGTYPITYTERAQTPDRDSSFAKLKFKDNDGNDTNATFTATNDGDDQTTVVTQGYWSDEGNKYAVWVNPEQCTLPLETQQVTYKIPIPATDTYTITGGSDDRMSVFLNNSTTPLTNFNDVPGGIFAGGSYTTPYSQTLTLNAGELILSVNCFNSAAGFLDSDNRPFGSAYDWARNPGGWYLKICRGTSCWGGNTDPWVKSGPHQAWNALMNEYAVYPSSVETLSGTPHSATASVNITQAGNYELEVSADNSATFTWDGVTVGTATGFTSSSIININNVGIGPHSLGVTVTNNPPASGNADNWSKNPGGVAYRLKYASGSTVNATFDSNGNIVTTGSGSREFSLAFQWDDNPSSYDTALGTYRVAGENFVQTPGVTSGSTTKTVTLEGGRTYTAVIVDNSGGFVVQQSGTRLCFRDLDGTDCNAQLDISAGSSVDLYASTSIDLTNQSSLDTTGNLVWTTRDATGYEITEVASEGGY